jgi:hypothetical protein
MHSRGRVCEVHEMCKQGAGVLLAEGVTKRCPEGRSREREGVGAGIPPFLVNYSSEGLCHRSMQSCRGWAIKGIGAARVVFEGKEQSSGVFGDRRSAGC